MTSPTDPLVPSSECTCAVGSVVVVPKHLQLRTLPHRDLSSVRHQVVGGSAGVFPDLARLVGADGVEVTQENNVPVLYIRRETPPKKKTPTRTCILVSRHLYLRVSVRPVLRPVKRPAARPIKSQTQ